MSLAGKQINFHKPLQMSQALNEAVRALAETYAGDIEAATTHCVNRVKDLTDARLTRLRGKNPPHFTRDGQSFVTLVWVLLVDGMLLHRPPQVWRDWLKHLIEATDLLETGFTEENIPALMEIFVQSIAMGDDDSPPGPEKIAQVVRQVWMAHPASKNNPVRQLPVLNRLFVGREADVQALYQRLGMPDKTRRHPLNIVRGWPGVGKTALINVIAHDEKIRANFSHGVLWASVGEAGDIAALFQEWAKQLGMLQLLQFQDLSMLSSALRGVLTERELLIIADDVWTVEQGLFIKNVVDLKTSTLLLTTRFTDVAEVIKDLPEDIYLLGTLSETSALELLTILAPEAVHHHRERIPPLIEALEGLPLALRVAGPTLQHYYQRHFDLAGLIDEFINHYQRLLGAIAPNDRFDEKTGRTPTIELLFRRSVQTLSPEAQLAFAELGVFKQKPATFAVPALEEVWETTNPTPVIDTLVGRGLLEAVPDQRYWIHQTLHMYANKLLDDLDAGLPL